MCGETRPDKLIVMTKNGSDQSPPRNPDGAIGTNSAPDLNRSLLAARTFVGNPSSSTTESLLPPLIQATLAAGSLPLSLARTGLAARPALHSSLAVQQQAEMMNALLAYGSAYTPEQMMLDRLYLQHAGAASANAASSLLLTQRAAALRASRLQAAHPLAGLLSTNTSASMLNGSFQQEQSLPSLHGPRRGAVSASASNHLSTSNSRKQTREEGSSGGVATAAAGRGVASSNRSTPPPIRNNTLPLPPPSRHSAVGSSLLSNEAITAATFYNDFLGAHRLGPGRTMTPPSAVSTSTATISSTTGSGGSCSPVLVFMECDDDSLSDYQCLLRKQIELFEATVDDVQWNAQGRNKSIVLGQVGIRCRYCARLPTWSRARGAVYYSATLDGLYQAAQNMSKNHLCKHCRLIPEDDKKKLVGLRDCKRRAAGGKKYWAEGAQVLGVEQCIDGLRFRGSTTGRGGLHSTEEG